MSTFTDALGEMGNGAGQLEDAASLATKATADLAHGLQQFEAARQGSGRADAQDCCHHTRSGQAALDQAAIHITNAIAAIADYLGSMGAPKASVSPTPTQRHGGPVSSRPGGSRAAPGEQRQDPTDTEGAKIANTEDLKTKARRARELVVNKSGTLAKDVGKLTQQARKVVAAKDPGSGVQICEVRTNPAYPITPDRPDAQHTASSIVITAVFLFDIVVHTVRKAQKRDR